MDTKEKEKPDAMRKKVEGLRERLVAEIAELDKDKDQGMLAYLLTMAKLECDDIVDRTGRHAH